MEKEAVLKSVATKLKALDNEVKLKILALLIEEGAKSITDISKTLNINFSTAHKYLEQLEEAKLVTSKQVADNRLKRLFYVQDFNIDLSPTGIANLFAKTKKSSSKLKVINESGEVVDFDEKLFSQKYLKRGLPRGLIAHTLSTVLEQAYKGITLLELRELFRKALEKRAQDIENVLEQLEKSQHRDRTFANLMSLVHPEALEQHARGDIFIRNLREPKLLNFVHDLRGIVIHGVSGKVPKTFKELMQQLLVAIKAVDKLAYPYHSFESFNYVIAPFTVKMKDAELLKQLKEFFKLLDATGINFSFSLDIGVSKFAESFSPHHVVDKKELYSKYKNEAQRINSIIFKIFKESKPSRFFLVLKLWQKQMPSIKGLRNFFIANMSAKWQHPNATYVGASRFDWRWKKWDSMLRVGEIQDITINVPRIALRNKNKQKFFNSLKVQLDYCIDFLNNMAELTLGEFLRKHKTTFKSAVKERWDYVNTSSCTYAISLTGVEDAAQILSKNKKDKDALRLEIAKFCYNHLLNKNSPIRIELKESQNKIIDKRFFFLDAAEGHEIKGKYHSGIEGDSLTNSLVLQKYFSAGHCVKVSLKDLPKVLKKEFGLIYVK